MKRILVSMTKDTGDSISVSVKIDDGNFSSFHKKKLKDDIGRKIIPYVDEALYFKIRYNEKVGKLKGITDSIKVSSVVQLNSEIDNIFTKLGVSDE